MIYLKITKNEKKVLTNVKFDATIGPSPAGVNPISPPVPHSPPKGSQSYPCWFAQRGFFFGATLLYPSGSQINHTDNLKSRKNMSGLHGKCRGGGVSLAYPRTSHIFLSCLSHRRYRNPANRQPNPANTCETP